MLYLHHHCWWPFVPKPGGDFATLGTQKNPNSTCPKLSDNFFHIAKILGSIPRSHPFLQDGLQQFLIQQARMMLANPSKKTLTKNPGNTNPFPKYLFKLFFCDALFELFFWDAKKARKRGNSARAALTGKQGTKNFAFLWISASWALVSHI